MLLYVVRKCVKYNGFGTAGDENGKKTDER